MSRWTGEGLTNAEAFQPGARVEQSNPQERFA